LSSIGPAQIAELDRQESALSLAPLERLGQQHFIVAHTVKIAGIDQGNPGVESGVNCGNAFGIIDRAITAGHAHAAKPGRGDIVTCLSDLKPSHLRYLNARVRKLQDIHLRSQLHDRPPGLRTPVRLTC